MALTGDTVRAALAAVGAVGRQLRSFDDLAAGANGALAQAPAGLTVEGAAAFLATQGQESDYFRATTEYNASKSDYAPYVGRTFDMVTWRKNYDLFGQWCHDRGLLDDPDTFVNNPASLADYRWAWLGGVWYFQANGLWPYANRGDFRGVSQGVNGGMRRVGTTFIPHGWTERQKMYAAFRQAGIALLPGPRSLSFIPGRLMVGADVEALQRALGVFPDGKFGPDTDKALRAYQRDHDLTPDGIQGAKTRTALGL